MDASAGHPFRLAGLDSSARAKIVRPELYATEGAMKRIRTLLGDAMVVLGATVFALMFLETVMTVAVAAKSAFAPGNLANYKPYYDTPPFRDAPWKHQHADDISQVRYDLDMLLHIPRPIETETVNVDGLGRRSSCCQADTPTSEVWVIGGSTVWGSGVNDANTIVSHLNRVGAPNGIAFVNLGRIGTSSTQNIHMLVQALLRSPSPEAVIFHIGANDANVLDLDGAADRISMQQALEDRLRGGVIDLALGIVRQSATYKVANSIGARLSAMVRSDGTELPPANETVVASGIEVLHRNIGFLRRLSAGLGIDIHVMLQPYLLSGIEVEAGVASERETALYRSVRPTSLATTAAYYARARRVDGIVDLSSVFVDAGVGDEYFDVVHLGPNGNRIVAEAIYAKLSPAWSKRGD